MESEEECERNLFGTYHTFIEAPARKPGGDGREGGRLKTKKP